MVHTFLTSFSFISVIAFASCDLSQDMFSISEVEKSSTAILDTNAFDLNAVPFTGSLQTIDIAMQDATGIENQHHLIEPVTSLSISPDLLTTIPEGSLSGYIFNLFYDDMECKGPAVSGFSVKLNTCSPNNDIYFFVTTTLTQTIQTYYTDSLCTKLSSISTTPYQKGCMMGFTNYVGSSFILPTKEPHVAIR